VPATEQGEKVGVTERGEGEKGEKGEKREGGDGREREETSIRHEHVRHAAWILLTIFRRLEQ